MANYGTNPKTSDRLTQIRDETQQVTDIMRDNVGKVIERGEKIEILVDKSDQLDQSAAGFKLKSRALKNQLWWKNCRFYAFIGIIVVGFSVIIGLIAYYG